MAGCRRGSPPPAGCTSARPDRGGVVSMDSLTKMAIEHLGFACEYALTCEARAVAAGDFEHAASMAEAAERHALSAFEWASL